MKIFVGSSKEARMVDNQIRRIMEEFPNTDPVPWKDIFLPGEYGLDSLLKTTKKLMLQFLLQPQMIRHGIVVRRDSAQEIIFCLNLGFL